VRPFGALLALDARLLFKRTLFRTVTIASVLAATVAALATGARDGDVHSGAWLRLSQAVSVVVPLLLSFGAVLGAVSLAGDAASGSLRGVLVRPVSRTGVVLSRAFVLAAGLTAVYAVSILVSLLASAAVDRFDAVTLGTGELASELIPREDLVRVVPRLIAMALPALICSTLVGLMVSACWSDPSSSAISALLLVLSPYLVEALAVESSPWMFTHGAAFGSSVLSELAGGVARRLAIASNWGDLWIPFLTPLLTGAAAVAAGCVVFSVRDFRN
jgi:hypothetical protein